MGVRGPGRGPRAPRHRGARRLLVGRRPAGGRRPARRPRGAPAGVNLNPGRTGLLGVMRRMGVDVREEPGPPVAGEPCGTLVVSPLRRPARHRGRAGGGALDDRRAPARGAARARWRHGTTVVRGAAELRVKESDRIASVVAALRAMRRATPAEREDGFEVHGTGRAAGRRRRVAWATTGWRCSARWPGSRACEGVAGAGLRGGRRLLPRLRRATSPRWGRCPRDRGHRRPRRRGQEHGGARGGPPSGRWPTSTPGRCTAALTWLALERGVDALGRRRPSPPWRATSRSSIEPTDDGDRVRVDGQDVTDAIRAARGRGRVSEVSAHPGVREEMVAAQRALLSSGVVGLRRPRRGHRGLPRGRPQGLPDRVAWRSAPAAGAPSWRARGVEVDEPTVLEDVRRRDHLRHHPRRPARCGWRRGRS